MLNRYLGNLKLYFQGYGPWYRFARANGAKAWLKFIFVFAIDQGVNTFTGGDPRETVSERVWVDRKQSFLANIINRIANAIFHPDGPSIDPTTGDDSPDNLELSGPWQLGVSLFWLASIWLLWGLI